MKLNYLQKMRFQKHQKRKLVAHMSFFIGENNKIFKIDSQSEIHRFLLLSIKYLDQGIGIWTRV